MPDKGISGARHSVGRFRGSVASVGVLWRSGRSALLGAFGRAGVGESVGVGRSGSALSQTPEVYFLNYISGITFLMTGSRER